MTILFVVALILAWPTAGLSIVAYVALFIARAYFQAKARMHHVDTVRAQREVRSGYSGLPSWMASRDKIEMFVHGVQGLAARHGVPKLFCATLMSNEQYQKNMMLYAGAMETQGASFVEQQMAIADKLIEQYHSE